MKQTISNHPNARTDSLIRSIVEHTHHVYGVEFFKLLVKHLSEALQVHGAWVTELNPKEQKLNSIAFWIDGDYVSHYEYDIKNTPCEQVISTQECFLVPDKVVELFPDDPDLKPYNAVSYMGYPMFNESHDVIGHLAILHNAALNPDKEQDAIFNLFVQRANAELLRMKSEEELLERKTRLTSLVNSMYDAIIELETSGLITFVNPSAGQLFGLPESEIAGTLLFNYFDDESSGLLRQTLKGLREHQVRGHEYVTRHELQCLHTNGEINPAEATFCHYEVNHNTYLTLLLRDIKELRRNEQRLEILENPVTVNGHKNAHQLIGQCSVIRKVMEDLVQIAQSNSTLLLVGESGTGKEVFARYVHEHSPRKEKPLIKVNCAAIPANLIESEFFGHEKGAFTGAVVRRDGRFMLANGGTLFLDEVGELPIEMQPKLLRVLQEGEFETVGGQRTLKVNVRIIAATNRNLEEMIKAGTFREDLYYRLNVIPVTLPPLRERGNDILLLAEMMIRKFIRQTGKKINPLSVSSQNRLLSYAWPGNIRELEHVIERAIILSRDGNIFPERFLVSEPDSGLMDSFQDNTLPTDQVMTMAQIEKLERDNIIRALHKTSWKISGINGAANLLGIPPTTLNSKIKSLKIEKSMIAN